MKLTKQCSQKFSHLVELNKKCAEKKHEGIFKKHKRSAEKQEPKASASSLKNNQQQQFYFFYKTKMNAKGQRTS